MTENTAETPAGREASGDDWATIEFADRSYQVPATIDGLDIDVIEAFENGKTVAAVKGTFGPRQWAALERNVRKDNDGRFPVALLGPLGDKIAVLYGFSSPGE